MSTSVVKERYLALDSLRGLTIALMILVNTPGSWSHVYGPLLHADWHGCTPTDLVFPFFMFIVGAAMYFAFNKAGFVWTNEKGLKILKRVAIIFAIGLFLNIFPFQQSIENWRIMGVLQRIALAYGLAAVLVLHLRQRGIFIVSLIILLGYWTVLVLFGGSEPFSANGNVGTKIDLAILGASHLWTGLGVPFDPEGLLSTLPSVVNVLIGFELGRWISQQKDPNQSVLKLIVAGVIAVVIGFLWGMIFPINKSLWTSSFVIYTAGYFALVLAFFVWIVDVLKWQSFAQPFIIYGSNPLFIYALSILWLKMYFLIPLPEAGNLYNLIYNGLSKMLSPINASLAFALLHVFLFWCISWMLYRKKIFIKV